MAVNPGDLARRNAAPHSVPGTTPGSASGPTPGSVAGPAFDADALVSGVDALLSSDAEGAEEAALLEQAHRLINDAMEGR